MVAGRGGRHVQRVEDDVGLVVHAPILLAHPWRHPSTAALRRGVLQRHAIRRALEWRYGW